MIGSSALVKPTISVAFKVSNLTGLGPLAFLNVCFFWELLEEKNHILTLQTKGYKCFFQGHAYIIYICMLCLAVKPF